MAFARDSHFDGYNVLSSGHINDKCNNTLLNYKIKSVWVHYGISGEETLFRLDGFRVDWLDVLVGWVCWLAGCVGWLGGVV